MAQRDDALSGANPSNPDSSIYFSGNPNMESEFPLNIPQEAHANQENQNCTSNNPNPQQNLVDCYDSFREPTIVDSFWEDPLLEDLEEFLGKDEPNTDFPASTSKLDHDSGFIHKNSNPGNPSNADSSIDFSGNPNMESEFSLNTQEADANQENQNCTSNNPNPQQKNVDGNESFWEELLLVGEPNTDYPASTSKLDHVWSSPSTDFSGNPNMESECEFEFEFPFPIPQEAGLKWAIRDSFWAVLNPEEEPNTDYPASTSKLDQDWGFIHKNSNPGPERKRSVFLSGYSSSDNLSSFSDVVTDTRQNSGICCNEDTDASGSGPSTPSFVNRFSNLPTASQGSHDQVSNSSYSSLNIGSVGEHPPQKSGEINHQDKKKGKLTYNVKKRKKHFPQKLDDKDNSNFEGESCAICKDMVIEKMVLDPCQHWLCRRCMLVSMVTASRCPLCQSEFTNISIQKSSIHPRSSNDIQSLSSESDGDEALSSQSKEMQSELPAEVNDKQHEVNCKVPATGMEFSSEEVAYKYYKNYAAEIGFSVRKGKIQWLPDGTIRKRYFLCSKQGFRLKKQSDKTTKYKRKETRIGCEAKIQFTVENGKWVVSHVVLKHNHDLENPSQRHKVDSWTKISETHSSHTINEVGIAKEAGAGKCVGLLKMDYSNYLQDRKLNSLQPEDHQSLINHLKHMQIGDPSFFYTVQVDAENRITNFLWRDGRSKMDYDYFGDVLILDTTFNVNKFDMICAPFLGLNHHQNHVLFGCAFLLDETVDSYIWLFGNFMEAMGHHRPKTIFTDECQAKANAIEVMLPDTLHRLYPRYLYQNAANHLPIDCSKPGFETLWNRCIFQCESRGEFELIWNALLDLYNLHENPWLKYLYPLWDKWSHFSVGKTFSAGIQSSESTIRAVTIRHVFQNMTGETMTLPKFAQQYEQSAEQRRSEELREDFDCNESASVMIVTNSEMEKQAADVYTPTMFKLFQGELLGCLLVAIEEMASDEMTATFKLTEHNKKEYIVIFNCSNSTVSCSCEKFESVGILCLHAIRVLKTKNIFYIPPQYILKRWTKHAKSGVIMDDYGGEMVDKSHMPLSLRTSKLMHIALNVITKSAAKEESMKIAEEHLKKALKEVDDVLQAKSVPQKHMSMSR